MKRNIIIILISVLIIAGLLAFARTTTTDLGIVLPTWDEEDPEYDILSDLIINWNIVEDFANDPLEFDTGERLEDRVGAMITGSTQTLITFTYQDLDNTIDAEVEDDLSLYDNTTSAFISSTLTENEVEAYIFDADAETILGNWVNTNHPWADNEVSDTLTCSTCTGNSATVTGFTPASGSLTLAGADALTLTTTAETNVTLPTSGTLATTAELHTILTIDTAGGLSLVGQALSMATADTDTQGTLTAADWDTFNDKISATGANTTITSILNAGLYVGRDADNQLNWATDNQLDIEINGVTTSIVSITAGTGDNDKLVTQGYVDDEVAGAGGYTDLVEFVDQTAFRVFYSDTAGDVTELALGADGTYLMSNGADQVPSFETPAGGGDVIVSGTPENSQIAVWTDASHIEGAATLTYDGSNLQLTGDIASTGTRITKGWFTNLEVTNDITIGGTALASIYAVIAQTMYIGTTQVAINRSSAALTLAGITLTTPDIGTPSAGVVTNLSGAFTAITSMLNAALVIGRDSDNTIDFGTDNNIIFKTNGSAGALFYSTGELDMNAASIGFTMQTAGGDGTTTIDWKLGNHFKFTHGAMAETFSFTAPTNPCSLLLIIVQDGVGGRDCTWPESVKWLGTEPTWTDGGAGKGIAVGFEYDGTYYWAQGTPWEE